VPLVLGTGDDVWAGSRGPLLYESTELAATAHLWNAKPICIFHPDMFEL